MQYEDEKESLSAIDWLGHLHYQICNGGMAQACYNGYVDDVIDVYGSFNKWVEELKKEVDESTEEGQMAIKAATMIAQKVDDIPKVKNCMDCDGSGYTEYEEEDEDGETQTIEEPCDTCGGQGFYDVEDYKDVDLDDDNWDNRYYTEIESEPIDKLTNQSSTHSVVLDAIKGVKESMDIKEAKEYLNSKGFILEDTNAEQTNNLMTFTKALEKFGNENDFDVSIDTWKIKSQPDEGISFEICNDDVFFNGKFFDYYNDGKIYVDWELRDKDFIMNGKNRDAYTRELGKKSIGSGMKGLLNFKPTKKSITKVPLSMVNGWLEKLLIKKIDF